MNLEQIKTLFGSGGGALIAIFTLVQITPIKINPWTWIFRRIGNIMLNDVSNQIRELSNHVGQLDSKVSVLDAERLEDNATIKRTRILSFADDIRRNIKHSEEMFNQILDDITDYETYCQAHPNYKNRRATAAINIIVDTHRKCVENNSFL